MGNLSSQDIKSALGSVEAIAREGQSREVLQALPVAVYTTDAEGRITYFNDAAAELWGQKPELGTNEWCGSWRLDWPAALRDLGARTAEGKMAEEACAIAAQALAGHARDIPFALLYLVDEAGQRARLVGATGVGKGEAAAPVALELDRVAGRDTEWPLAEVLWDGGDGRESVSLFFECPGRSVVGPAAHGGGGSDQVEHRTPARGISDCRGESAVEAR
jgi:PAS fold